MGFPKGLGICRTLSHLQLMGVSPLNLAGAVVQKVQAELVLFAACLQAMLVLTHFAQPHVFSGLQ